jgi:hypothetical protein
VVGTHLYAFLQEQVVPVSDPCAGETSQGQGDCAPSTADLSALYKVSVAMQSCSLFSTAVHFSPPTHCNCSAPDRPLRPWRTST